ncbi:MAG: manganese efflux pump [Treponema sp.]|nr:manganese efflux pump [Candidatus Treponema merdequi]
MNYDAAFFINSILLGVGLAMDAFSVSLANGLNEPKMKAGRMSLIAGVFAIFQAAMPMIGWTCVHTVVQYFSAFEKFIPWIALILLLYIGGKMLIEGIKGGDETEEGVKNLAFGALMVQGVATSIDALSVGFTIADYNFMMALVCALIIAIVTFGICIAGLIIGKKVGTKIAGKANILGGVILIGIGIEIFVKGVFL